MSELDIVDEDFLLHTNYTRNEFKLLTNIKNDSPQRIAVFGHKNPQYVCIYESTTKDFYFRCIECHSMKQEVKGKLSDDGQNFKVFEPFLHICSPLRYLDAVIMGDDTLAIDEQPLEEPMPSSSSTSEEEKVDVDVLSSKSKMKKVATNQNGDDNEWKILDSSKFEFGCSPRRISKTRLMVFESEENPNKVRIYGIDCNKKHYKCLKCNVAKAYVENYTVKVLQAHSCYLLSYAKAKAEQEKMIQLRIVYPEEYEYGMNKNREAKKRLIIFEPNDRFLARDYGYNNRNCAFICLKCQPKCIAAKVLKDESGNEYVEVSNGHRCKPRPYNKIKAEQDSLKDASEKYEIFKSRKFKFLLNARGAKNGRLIIFPAKDQGYEYFRQTKNT